MVTIHEPCWYIVIIWSPFFIEVSLVFPWCPLVVVVVLGCSIALSCHASCPVSLKMGQLLRLPLFLMTLSVSRSPGRVFCRISFSLCLPDVFLIIRPGFCVLEVKRHFHHILSRVHTTHIICPRWCWPWSCGGGDVLPLSACKVPRSPSFPHCLLRRDVHSSQLRTGASSQPPRREEYLHKLHERLVSSLPFIDITVDHLFPFLSPWSHNTYQSLVLSEFSIGFVERMRVYEASDLCPFKILMLKP